jgi:HEAT repeat protein
MGSPDNSAPPRPHSVPADARWDPKDVGFEWVLGACDAEGRRHGAYRSWTRDGHLHGECAYDHGKVDGINRNFHPDGTVASEATWVGGVIMDSAFFRSEAPTTEPFAQAAAPEVWSVRYYTRDGTTNYTIRYFLRDGTECGPDGNALPVRPVGVSPDARWFPDIDRWVDGEIARGTNLQVGHWRWWSRDGALRHEEKRDASGAPLLVVQYHADGTTERAYAGEVLASVREKTRAGVLAFEARREGPAIACVLYGGDGKTLAATGLLVDDKLAGTWRIFDDRGEVRRELDLTELAIAHHPTGRGLAWRLGEACFRTDEDRLGLPAQLAGVDGEPWAETAGRTSEQVARFPTLLRALASPDPLVRTHALGAIEDEIEHQGTTYPATALVIPYLARLLSHPLVDRAALLATLQAAAESALASGDEPSVNAAAGAWPHVFALFPRAKAAERRQILVLAKFAPDARTDLLELARHDGDPAVRACAVDSLAAMQAAELAQQCLADRDPLVRAAAAIAIGCARGPETAREVVTALRESLGMWRELAPRYAELPFADLHVLAYLSLAAGSIRSADARSLAQALCATIEEVDARSAATYGQGLLALAIGTGERPFAKRCVEILATLAHSRKFWVFDVHAKDVLEKWNLPRDQTALQELVDELEHAPDAEALLHRRIHT